MRITSREEEEKREKFKEKENQEEEVIEIEPSQEITHSSNDLNSSVEL